MKPCCRLLSLVLLVIASPWLSAQDSAGASPSVASGDAELMNSHVYIRVDKARVGHVHAVIGQLKSGQLRLRAADDPKIEPGSLVFDMTSFDADRGPPASIWGWKSPSMRTLAKQESTRTCLAKRCWMFEITRQHVCCQEDCSTGSQELARVASV